MNMSETWEYVEPEYLSHDAPGYSKLLSEGGILATDDEGEVDWIVQCEIEPRYGRLIAAAPEMLEVLNAARIMLKNRDQRPEEMKLLDAIKYVVAKAEGR
jgi:hypothetical protein